MLNAATAAVLKLCASSLPWHGCVHECVCVCACMRTCVCVRERERKREIVCGCVGVYKPHSSHTRRFMSDEVRQEDILEVQRYS